LGGAGLSEQWEFWIDRGGTFTDIVALDPKGNVHTHKLLSQTPDRYRNAAVIAGNTEVSQATCNPWLAMMKSTRLKGPFLAWPRRAAAKVQPRIAGA
jgi:hypothetical protein